MRTTQAAIARRATVDNVRRQRRVVWIVAGFGVLFVALFLTAFSALHTGFSGIALLVLLASITAAAIRPVLGVYAIVFFALIGDIETVTWFPFNKNMSASESLLYVANPLTFSPLEILIGVTVLFWLIDLLSSQRRTLITVPTWWATAVFTGFVVMGFAYGISNGGDIRIALFEGRAIFILLPLFTLFLNLCDERRMRTMTWVAVVAIFINSLFAIWYFLTLTPVESAVREALGEHSASTHFNAVIVLFAALAIYKGGTRLQRTTLGLLLIPILLVYVVAQRRAAVASLVVVLGILVLSLWWRNRRLFLIVAPTLIIVGMGYTGAFWNNTSLIGFPAQAVKSVIAPGSVSEEDQSSDVYREIETYDLNFTVRTQPVFGVGFGNRFHRPFPLPDISFFEFYEYIPHNSILWIWVKTGFGGFAAMFVMFALAIRAGTSSLISDPDPTSAAYRMVGLGYVVGFAIFAYVDIAFDPRTMVFLALAFGLCTIRAPRTGDLVAVPDQQSAATPITA